MEFHLAQADQGMDWLQFIASIIGSIAWPIAAVAIAWMFKRQISALLDKVRRLSWGDGSVDLADQLTVIETVALEAAPLEMPAPEVGTPTVDAPVTDGQASEPAPEPAPEQRHAASVASRTADQADELTTTRVNAGRAAELLKKIGRGGKLPLRGKAYSEAYSTPNLGSLQIARDWHIVDTHLRQLTHTSGSFWTERLPTGDLIDVLLADRVIDVRLHGMLAAMELIHSASLHEDVSASEAFRFQQLSHQVITELNDIRRTRRPDLPPLDPGD